MVSSMVRKLYHVRHHLWIAYLKVDVSTWLIGDVGEEAAAAMTCNIPHHIARRYDLCDARTGHCTVSPSLRASIANWNPPPWLVRENWQFRPSKLAEYVDNLQFVRDTHRALRALYAEQCRRPSIINACRAGVLSGSDEGASFLWALPHRMLQRLCAALGYRASGNTDALVERLAAHISELKADVRPYLETCTVRELRQFAAGLGVSSRGLRSRRAATARLHWHCAKRLAVRRPLFNEDLSLYIRDFL